MKKEKERIMPIHTKNETTRVFFRDIVYIESDLRKVIVHSVNGDYSFYGKLGELQKILDERFYRCHIRYIINFDMIRSARDGVLYMEYGEPLFMGYVKYRQVRRHYARYLNAQAGVEMPQQEETVCEGEMAPAVSR